MTSFINLFEVASMPVLKMLLIIAIGSILALNRFDILGKTARHHLNKVVFYVFGPALVGSSLAQTLTFKSFLALWFMPVNILMTFLIGSALGWVFAKLTKAPRHIKGLIIASCSAGNLGILPIVLIPAMCKEKSSPFGAVDICERDGLAYASLSMALGSIFMWVYTYNIVRITCKDTVVDENAATDGNYTKEQTATRKITSVKVVDQPVLSLPEHSLAANSEVGLQFRIIDCLKVISKKLNLKAMLAPSTIGAIVGSFAGMIPPIRKLLIGNKAPLHVATDTASMIGAAAIPSVTFIIGANLLQSLKGSSIRPKYIIGIIAVRYIYLPLSGILIIKGAIHAGLVQAHDILFQFTLLLQYALPPAMTIGTMTELFGAGQSECSVIMLWTYALASVVVTLWSTAFLWIVAAS